MKWTSFIARVRDLALQARSPDDALRLAIQYGYLRRLNHDGVYGDAEFEQAIYSRLVDHLSSDGMAHGPDVLHVLTQSYPIGGHTRLALEWIRIRAGIETQSVVFTRTSDPSTIEFLDLMAVPHYHLAGTPLDRLKEIVGRFPAPKTVVLHIHPEDCVGATAAMWFKERGVRVLFVNHADHVFTFGMPAANFVLEVSGFGWLTTKNKRDECRQSFLGIPLPDRSRMSSHSEPNSWDRNGPLLSVGAPIKYKPSREVSFADFLNRIVEVIPNKFDLIGPDGTEPWWQELNPRARERVRFLGKLPLEEARIHMRECAAYIDSFPFTGGSAFQEAFIQGAPAFGLRIGASGYGMVDSLRHEGVEDLVTKMDGFFNHSDAEDCFERHRILRGKILQEFSDEAMSRRIDAVMANESVPILDELLANAGDLAIFENSWQADDPVIAVVPFEVPKLIDRMRLLWTLAAFRDGHIGMSRKKLLKFAVGIRGT